jgi:hypothetical protein
MALQDVTAGSGALRWGMTSELYAVWAGAAGGVADGDGDLRVRKSLDCRIAAINDDCLRREIARNI